MIKKETANIKELEKRIAELEDALGVTSEDKKIKELTERLEELEKGYCELERKLNLQLLF